MYVWMMMECKHLDRGQKYHEPEHWKFGEEGNKYFRHATGQIYAISKDLASYISINSYYFYLYLLFFVSLGESICTFVVAFTLLFLLSSQNPTSLMG